MLESSPRHSCSGAWPSPGMLSDTGNPPRSGPRAERRLPAGGHKDGPGLVGGEPALPEELKGLALLSLLSPLLLAGTVHPWCSGRLPSPVVPSPALQRNTFLGWNSPRPTTWTAVCVQRSAERRPRGAPLPALHGGLPVQPQARPRSHTVPAGPPLPGSRRWMAAITAAPARSPGPGTGTGTGTTGSLGGLLSEGWEVGLACGEEGQ